jgi:ribosomal protein S18 acetylase RimI-like enzyme
MDSEGHDKTLPGLSIRAIREADEADVIALWDRCGLLRPWNDPHDDIAQKLTMQRDLFLVGTVAEEIIATVMAGYDGHRGWINYLAVDPMHRRQGFARLLVTEVEERMRDLGCAKINLQIRRDNPDAIAFYERVGFAEDAVVSMGKRLERQRS